MQISFGGCQVTSRASLDTSELAFELQELIPSWCWTLGGQNGLKTGHLEAWKAAVLSLKRSRIRFRMWLGGFQVGSWCSVGISCRACELEKSFPTCFWWFEGQHGPKHVPRRPQKGAILRLKRCRIRFRIGLAGLKFLSRSYADIGDLS